MNRICLCFATMILFAMACKRTNMDDNPNPEPPPDTTKPAVHYISVTTMHNNNDRTGWNDHETILNVNNVNSAHFGKLFEMNVDDDIYAQPLVVSNLSIAGGTHNVVYLTTVNNSVYAFNADDGTPIWQKNFTPAGMRPPSNADLNALGACGGHYLDFSANFGIVGTAVIDSAAQTMYFVTRGTDGTNAAQYLHAINILTGGDVAGSPVKITASVAGHGDGAVNDSVPFNAITQNQRQGLTITNGTLFITWGSHCDVFPYHGWVMGYDPKTLQQTIVYNTTPDGGGGGIWQSGMAPAADANGNLYTGVGNGTVGVDTDYLDSRNRAESSVKLSVSGNTMTVATYFTPTEFAAMNPIDHDFGSIGALLVPNSNYFFTGSKGGILYLLDRDNMGGYTNALNQVHQALNLNIDDEHCQAAYYKGTSNEFIYVWSQNNPLHAFPFDRSSSMLDLNHLVLGTVAGPTGLSGADLSVSSHGSLDSTAILWAAYGQPGCDAGHYVCAGELHAFAASDVTKELWNSKDDPVGDFAKFSPPTIVNGHVYLSTFSKKVVVYGLKP